MEGMHNGCFLRRAAGPAPLALRRELMVTMRRRCACVCVCVWGGAWGAWQVEDVGAVASEHPAACCLVPHHFNHEWLNWGGGIFGRGLHHSGARVEPFVGPRTNPWALHLCCCLSPPGSCCAPAAESGLPNWSIARGIPEQDALEEATDSTKEKPQCTGMNRREPANSFEIQNLTPHPTPPPSSTDILLSPSVPFTLSQAATKLA